MLKQTDIGSSPRTWGIQSIPSLFRLFQRFIPTCVGHTDFDNGKTAINYGSSPRAWGIRSRRPYSQKRIAVHPHVRGAYDKFHETQYQNQRFIPTCVGHTKSIQACSAPSGRFIPTCVGHTMQCGRI